MTAHIYDRTRSSVTSAIQPTTAGTFPRQAYQAARILAWEAITRHPIHDAGSEAVFLPHQSLIFFSTSRIGYVLDMDHEGGFFERQAWRMDMDLAMSRISIDQPRDANLSPSQRRASEILGLRGVGVTLMETLDRKYTYIERSELLNYFYRTKRSAVVNAFQPAR